MKADAEVRDRLAPVHDALAVLERTYLRRARAENEPEAWATWADLHAALMAVRSVQGREARADRYRPINDEGAPA